MSALDDRQASAEKEWSASMNALSRRWKNHLRLDVTEATYDLSDMFAAVARAHLAGRMLDRYLLGPNYDAQDQDGETAD